MRGTMRALVLVATMAAVAGCGPKPGAAPRAQPVPVRVSNNNRADVVLYLVRSGTPTRLGTVVSGQTQVFTIRNVPLQQLQGIQFDVHRIGTEATARTRAVSLGPEQMVVIRIEDLLSTSQVSVAENPSSARRMP
jgi:hypothetical protein